VKYLFECYEAEAEVLEAKSDAKMRAKERKEKERKRAEEKERKKAEEAEARERKKKGHHKKHKKHKKEEEEEEKEGEAREAEKKEGDEGKQGQEEEEEEDHFEGADLSARSSNFGRIESWIETKGATIADEDGCVTVEERDEMLEKSLAEAERLEDELAEEEAIADAAEAAAEAGADVDPLAAAVEGSEEAKAAEAAKAAAESGSTMEVMEERLELQVERTEWREGFMAFAHAMWDKLDPQVEEGCNGFAVLGEWLSLLDFSDMIAWEDKKRVGDKAKKEASFALLIKQFKTADVDGDGYMTKVEQDALFANAGFDLTDPAIVGYVDEQWAMLDVNNDGRVNMEEFIEKADFSEVLESEKKVKRKRKKVAKMHAQFDQLIAHFGEADADGDGFLTRDEGETLFLKAGYDLTDSAVRDWIDEQWSRLDEDGDGHISQEEFCKSANLADMLTKQEETAEERKMVQQMQFENLMQQFAAADTDGDGFVTKEEQAQLFAKAGHDLNDPLFQQFMEDQWAVLDTVRALSAK
jgi:Ca2+-binding EF-hand superfamily protein